MNELKHPSQEWDLEDIVDINKLAIKKMKKVFVCGWTHWN